MKDDIGYDYVIACDLGYEHALKMGIKPDIMVSDFDSLDRSKFPVDEIALLEFPVRKDDSDTMLAIKHALCQRDDEFPQFIFLAIDKLP